MSTLTLVVLAGGLGSRFDRSDAAAKALAMVGPAGERIIDYSVYDAFEAGFQRVVLVRSTNVSTAATADIDAMVATWGHHGVDIVQRFQDKPTWRQKPWGTVHAVLTGADDAPGPFAVVNCDDFYGAAVFTAIATFLRASDPEGETHGLVSYPLIATLPPYREPAGLADPPTVTRGICRLKSDGTLYKIDETPGIHRCRDGSVACGTQPDTSLCSEESTSLNLFGFRRSIIATLQREFARFQADIVMHADKDTECILPLVVGRLCAEDRLRVQVLRVGDQWFGITYQHDLPHVREGLAALAERGTYPRPLWTRPQVAQ